VSDERAAAQLEALARVGALLDAAGIDHWLFGGWGRDFYEGRVTRPHGDVDFAVWLKDRPRIEEVLFAEGWTHTPDPDEDGGTGYRVGPVLLELTFLVRDELGDPCIDLKAGPARWPERLGDDVRELEGVRARLLPREAIGDDRAED
jgi:aminoglycoside-2''-adenylyltransferase